MNSHDDNRDPSFPSPEERRAPLWFWAFVVIGVLTLTIVPIWSMLHLE